MVDGSGRGASVLAAAELRALVLAREVADGAAREAMYALHASVRRAVRSGALTAVEVRQITGLSWRAIDRIAGGERGSPTREDAPARPGEG